MKNIITRMAVTGALCAGSLAGISIATASPAFAASCSNWTSNSSAPPTIRVLEYSQHTSAGAPVAGTQTGVYTVPFRSYVQDVLPNEWPYYWSTKPNAIVAFEAGAIAVKSFAWHKEQGAAYGIWHTQCYDVDDSINTQRYIPGSHKAATDQAVADTWNVVALNGGKVLAAGYRSGASGDPCAYWNGLMSQYGTLTCAAQSKTYQQIISIYYPGTSLVNAGSNPPVGNYETVIAGPGHAAVGGWALDPDTTAPIYVDIYRDSAFYQRVVANTNRPDVDQQWHDGPYHGFNATVDGLSAGSHNICVYALDSTLAGPNPLLGCRSVTIGGNPIGNFDNFSVGANHIVTLNGWTIDPDTSGAINVDVWYDNNSRYGGRFVANTYRSDVGNAYPAYGPYHGFSVQIALPVGTHNVCAFGINVGAGTTNPQLGSCKTVTA